MMVTYLTSIVRSNFDLKKNKTVIVYFLPSPRRNLLWRRWCNNWEWRWASFPNPRSYATATRPCASCDRRRRRSSRRRRKRRRRPRSPTLWTARTKQKGSPRRRSVTRQKTSLGCRRDFTQRHLSPRPRRTASDLQEPKNLIFLKKWERLTSSERTHPVGWSRSLSSHLSHLGRCFELEDVLNMTARSGNGVCSWYLFFFYFSEKVNNPHVSYEKCWTPHIDSSSGGGNAIAASSFFRHFV